MAEKPLRSIALIFYHGKLLFLRDFDSTGYPLSGFRLPREETTDFVTLAKTLMRKYGGEISLLEELTPHMGAKLFYVKEVTPLLTKRKDAAKFLDYEGLDKVYVDPYDKKIAKRALAFAALYLPHKKEEALSKDERKKAEILASSLRFFANLKLLPMGEVDLYQRYLDKAPDYEDAERAHAYLLEEYRLDMNRYLDALRYSRKGKA